MDPKQFLELTESALLKDIGERLHSFFSGKTSAYEPTEDGSGLYKKVECDNPRSAVLPIAQVNMVANVTFHLMAQQLAVLFHQRPTIDKEKVFQTTMDNVRRLTVYYMSLVTEEKLNEDNR